MRLFSMTYGIAALGASGAARAGGWAATTAARIATASSSKGLRRWGAAPHMPPDIGGLLPRLDDPYEGSVALKWVT
jgi:hypothetical protein